ncbi:hypothetical protein SCHPADRAFT_434774 [Schizopora paradoxa]|uniref:Uncharacterized protein n=1 Tax=Schizopora paradoxa TaxID=27342 RepID=A0A0H2RJX6_9AGAM|nr:hypothetical protein SCHPADRAFT_434774 [Schizopora paradoxa]
MRRWSGVQNFGLVLVVCLYTLLLEILVSVHQALCFPSTSIYVPEVWGRTFVLRSLASVLMALLTLSIYPRLILNRRRRLFSQLWSCSSSTSIILSPPLWTARA